MSEMPAGNTPNPFPHPREAVHRRIHLLRRAAVVTSLLGFAGIWNLVAHHTVGVTARASSSSAVQSSSNSSGLPSSGSGGFFGNGGDNGNSNGFGVGGGSGSNPVVGTGGS